MSVVPYLEDLHSEDNLDIPDQEFSGDALFLSQGNYKMMMMTMIMMSIVVIHICCKKEPNLEYFLQNHYFIK
jgi:hypothetical protein